jgi:hypothetical protein
MRKTLIVALGLASLAALVNTARAGDDPNHCGAQRLLCEAAGHTQAYCMPDYNICIKNSRKPVPPRKTTSQSSGPVVNIQATKQKKVN